MRDGKFQYSLENWLDITERKHAEEEISRKNRELEEVNARLQEVDRLKSIFISSMSHELRTPLNSIIGFTSLMLEGMSGDINEEQKEQLSLVKGSSDHLLSLINDILDVSKIEAGSIDLSPEEFRLSDVVQEVAETLAPTAEMKNLKLIVDSTEDIKVFTDRRRLKQILINLGGNAVKFTEHGSVRFVTGLQRNNGRKHNDNMEVRIIDTGIGIKKEDINKLFMPFQQVDGSLTRRYEGTGLGLHLTRKIVTALGGDIWVKSKYGKGSEFAFTLPLHYQGDKENEKNSGGR